MSGRTSDESGRRTGRAGQSGRWERGALAALTSVVLGAGGLSAVPAYAATVTPVTSAVFSGGTGTYQASSTSALYAKQGGALTLTLTAPPDTKCVDVSGAFTARQTSDTAKSGWTFSFTAPAGDGSQTVTVVASTGVNPQTQCTGKSTSTPASYTLDNTGPVVTAALTPAANAAGWNNTDVSGTWSASDGTAGSGVVSGPTPDQFSKASNGVETFASEAIDRLGNKGSSSVTVRVDKAKPTITGSETKNADGTSTVTFTCSDSGSGGASGIATCAADGTSPSSSSKTVPAGTTVTGTATDNAGNTATTSVTTTPSDKTPPTISGAVSPTPNAAGWNKADATVTFSCADEAGGSGLQSCLADGSTTASTSVTTETNGTLVGGTAKDRAGNTATSSVTVKVDKTNPTANASRNPVANGFGWNNSDVTVSFACADPGSQASGVKTCPAAVAKSQNGANQSVSGSAIDNADNSSAAASVTEINIDKTAPTLTGAPTTAADGTNGWYQSNVTIAWSASDALSGLNGPVPTNSTISSEGTGLTASTSVSDKAGNTTTASSAAVKIDKTAPNTGISGTSNTWVNGDVTITLSPTDNLSGVGTTTYSVDGGAPRIGTSFSLSADGDHTVTFFSTDRAGNVEEAQTVQVKIDKTAPTIDHVFTPHTYVDGAWTNSNVSVTFTCADQGGSAVASCTGDTTVSSEGADQKVVGTATDGAGNSATDTALVSIDKTLPTIKGSKDRAANDAGWYNDDVTVSFSATDSLSGIASTTANKTFGEGANQSVTGTATDAAGNSASDTVSGIDVDKTPPVLTGSFPSGWHTGDVTVTWSCTDRLSGPAGQPADSTVKGEGSNLSATATCTDNAGNSTTETVSGIQIDRTAPATGASVTGALNNGWYRAGIDIDLTASDNLSGVDKTYYSVDGGDPQLYSGKVSISQDGSHTFTWWSTDKAGNDEDTSGNSVTLKIDKTPPTLTGKATTSPNGNGWYAGDVTVDWTCSDTGSGLDGTCPADSTISGEGDNLSASASVSDKAGNPTSRTVDGIKIDRAAPTTTAAVPALPDSGWYKGDVEVTLTGRDNLSGVDKTYYSVDGGDAQVYGGVFSFDQEGTHEISFWSTDNAGHVETAGEPITLRIDKSAPVTTVINPISPASGWFVTSGIPFAFDANDGTDSSGAAATYYTIDGGARQTYGESFTAKLSTGTHTVKYWSVDVAGNTEAVGSFEVKVDTIAPTITGAQTPAANSSGWNNTPVDVTFTCTDEDSGIPEDVTDGIDGCAGDTTLVNDGAGQEVSGSAVDVAGNRNSTTYGPVNIDQTKPTLSGAATTDANGAGWYKGDVTIEWTGDDGLSGVDPATQPASSTITGEGDSLGAGPETIADKAGNVSDPASVTGIKIDRTAPVVSGEPKTQPNAAGWYRDSVTVDFSCTDTLSGVAICPTSTVVSGNGAKQSVPSGPATDLAGNASASKTVGGINIDGTAPTTAAGTQCTKTNGWCTGSTADVVLTAVDQPGLSGVQEIRYSVNGAPEQTAGGATKTVSVTLDGEGGASVTYYAVDKAGNVETANTVTLRYDNIAPAVTHTLTPKPNALDWNNSDVTVHFDANDAGSGVDTSTVTKDVRVSTETAGLVVNGSASDAAGNVGTDSVTVKLDKTAPSITGAIVAGKIGDNGWYVGPVTVDFTCFDALSGSAACPDDVVLTKNGANSALGTATDKAGNTASVTVSGINIDQELPTITGVNVQGQTYTLGAVPAATCTATDDVSGLAGACSVAVTGGTANGVGTFSYTATAKDKAGNTTTATGSYKVIYKWDGVLQPINDTAHQVGTSTSIFKAGSTVPVKLRLAKADGTAVKANVDPSWLTPAKGSLTSAPVDEAVYAESATSGSTYRWDSINQQYIYNWGNAKSQAGSYWRIGVKLDDGQTYYVNIGLR